MAHHAVPRKDGFLASVELSLTSRGFGEGDAEDPSLCRVESAVLAENHGPVSGLGKLFPGRKLRCCQRPVRHITIIALPPKCPELNPVENVWQFMRDNWLSNRVFKS
jgi:hypothetical protein